MRTINVFLSQLLVLSFYVLVSSGRETGEPVLYYYGLEESERSLPACEPRQACSAFMRRYWRPAAIVRLCRCPRRARCDTAADIQRTVPWNNRALFQFCHPVEDWPVCDMVTAEPHLTVETTYDRINPDQLEELHHKNIQLVPPKIVFTCLCPELHYWKINATVELNNMHYSMFYQCKSLPICKTGEFCGNVSDDMYALYQSCMCPKHDMCVHSGGVTHLNITELLYKGKGWRAYCQKISEDYNSYEDY